MPRSKIRDQLVEVGFDDARQAEIVGGLSGGWKMKLELARAMLYNADLLLLDEVRILYFGIICFIHHFALYAANKSCTCESVYSLLILLHFLDQLDRASVKWLEQYLIAHTNVTCLIISHDSGYVLPQIIFIALSKFFLRFLDNVTTDIIHYETKKVNKYLSIA